MSSVSITTNVRAHELCSDADLVIVMVWQLIESEQSFRRGKTKNFTGENFWARGYFVSTVELDEEMVRNYMREQEIEDERYEQLSLLKS